ncbi:hypothetical protein ILYODFUR_032359 [Ilyodon furcidens]|uniref:Uncharacterized protein n=1 Tax=Ilyodon furcidens TaxID=33524 RepID=A0ABV0ST53_9TELE
MILLPPARSFLIHIEKALAGRQHNDGKRSARCQGCERDLEGVKRSMVCCLAGALSLSALQDEQRTKQADVSTPAMWFGAQACACLLPSTFASSVKISFALTMTQRLPKAFYRVTSGFHTLTGCRCAFDLQEPWSLLKIP